jgi:hypothetical protein
MVAVGKPTFALIGLHQLAQFNSVDSATGLGQITGLIVSPQLAFGQRCDGLRKLAPSGAPSAIGDSAPMQRERPAIGVAFCAHGAVCRAAVALCGANWNWARLNIGRF